ncbi:uncharacterized membrane protein HdeD (DUF308 family) [Tibeticola sediminis]|uniref:Uncharacterized membrane protein HdeD (DUF308 family) n=1 Tax=Tibeticola sediminis TaxID=1917811 RepID=A0A3N4U9I9_9BURK|nr:DUF308 domain-containing protein [Tibeticola sediminis]RPE65035.1 uncharacterized membrane protein HdeD (DUF308 family) [Tibeticola sediminis]
MTDNLVKTPDNGVTRIAFVSLIQTNWKWLALRGVLALLFGAIALWSPLAAVYALTFVFGAYAFADGVLSVGLGIHHARQKTDQWWSWVLRGVLGIFAGIVVLVVPWAAAMTLVVFNWVLLSLWAIATGVFEFSAGRRLQREGGRGWILMLSGAISVAFGAAVPVVLTLNPAAGMVTMGLMMGVQALITGALLLALALQLRKSA